MVTPTNPPPPPPPHSIDNADLDISNGLLRRSKICRLRLALLQDCQSTLRLLHHAQDAVQHHLHRLSFQFLGKEMFYLDVLPLILLMTATPLVRTGQALVRLWVGRCRVEAWMQRWREEGSASCTVSSRLPATCRSLLSFSHLPLPSLPTLEDLARLHSRSPLSLGWLKQCLHNGR